MGAFPNLYLSDSPARCDLQLGVIYPQTEMNRDPAAVRAYAQGVEELGYRYVAAYDHIIGANPASRPAWRGAYDVDDPFMEPFTLFSFIAGCSRKLGLVTSVLILPQRQTVMVAKQAATLDVLSGGRVRLGVGIGWNDVEYEALGQDFHDRGQRSAEQIRLLRALWTEEVVDFHGLYHDISHAGINPLPVQRPIPIWMGGGAPQVVRRIGRLADGWFPQFQPDSEGQQRIAQMREYARAAGRDPSAVGIEGRINISIGEQDAWNRAAAAWDEAGATHVSVNTMRAGLKGPEQHIQAIERFKEAVSG
jgi:probable F420-dependent oxidoreductase